MLNSSPPIQNNVHVGQACFHNDKPLVVIAGPCMMESADLVDQVAGTLKDITQRLGMGFVFKSSFDKANRTSDQSPRGPGITEGKKLLASVRSKYDCPVLTDVHTPEQCDFLKDTADILQIPAFLCRQTDLITAAAQTGKTLHIKKGQFMAPGDMKHVALKAEKAGAKNILLCERGACFGYNNLVTDLRALPTLKNLGWPVVFDATHSVQQPGGLGHASGGQRQFVETVARGAVAVGVAAIYIETHPHPDQALSDGPNMVPLAQMESFLTTLKTLDQAAKSLKAQPFSA